MEKKKEFPISYYTGRAGSWTKRQLNIVDNYINKIESSNFIVRRFNKDSLSLLKQQKQYMKTMLSKEQELVALRTMTWQPTPTEIVKANKALEKQIKAGEEIKYVSKKEENHKRQRRVRSDKWKTHNYKRKVLKSSELKPRRLFYD